MIEKLRKRGVKDWHRYFARNEDQLAKAYDLGREAQINQAALDIYRVPDKQTAIIISHSAQPRHGDKHLLDPTNISAKPRSNKLEQCKWVWWKPT